MKPFTTLVGIAAPIDIPNVDTDQLAPARFLRKPREDGYQNFLFHDLRFNPDGSQKLDFILNQPSYAQAEIMVVNRNFGGGSSREQAVWCLVDYGVRCIIGTSFGDIFYNNAVNHGLLLIKESEQTCQALREQLHAQPGAQMKIDLESQYFTAAAGTTHDFEIEESRKKRLLLGLDEIGLTLQYTDQMGAFESTYRAERPWLFVNR
jgi:3-isopropylmalate/(R)-2-methylmalate dehydratase small subunit